MLLLVLKPDLCIMFAASVAKTLNAMDVIPAIIKLLAPEGRLVCYHVCEREY